jgi:hypothetical protein
MKMSELALLIAAAVSISSCVKGKFPGEGGEQSAGSGKPRPIARPPAAGSLQSLGLDLIQRSSPDRELPGEESFQGGIAALDPVYLEDEIIMRKTIVLTGDTSPLFVVPEGEGDRRIVNLSYALRTQNPENEQAGEPVYLPAAYDRDSHRHFISLHSALAARSEDLSPSNVRILTFRVQFEKDPMIYVTLRFWVAGPLVGLKTESETELILPLHPYTFENPTPLALRRLVFANPMDRAVRLWVRFPATADHFRVTGMGKVHRDFDNRTTWQAISWAGTAAVTGLKVSVGDQASENLPAARAWKAVEIGPRQKVVFEIQARTGGCRLEFPRQAIAHEYQAYGFDGNWGIELALTDGWLPSLPPEVSTLAASDGISLGKLGRTERRMYGSWNPEVFGAAHRFNCR